MGRRRMNVQTRKEKRIRIVLDLTCYAWKGNCADEIQVLAVILCKLYRLETFIPDFPLLLSWMLLRLFCKAGPAMKLVEDGALA